MRLSAKVIKNFSSINNFDYTSEWNVRANEPNTLYFQLVDLDQDGLRYLPIDVSYGVSVTFPALDSTQILTITATQVNSLDRSVWKVDLSSSQVPKSGSVQFSISEAGITKRFSLLGGMSVDYPQNEGSC